MTGAKAYTLDDVAALLSEQTGRTIARRVIPDDEQARRMSERGLAPAVVDMTLAI